MLEVMMPEAFTFTMNEVPLPEVKENEVLIDMERLGICGSDMQIYHGKHKFMSFPIVLGHEGSGTLTQVGDAVKNFAVGDRVTVQPQNFCGDCYPCRQGLYNVCEKLSVMGVHETGMSSDYFVTDASKLLKLPAELSFDQGALIEPISVATAAIRKVGGVAGAKVAVLGAGPIGNLVAQVANASGAADVLILDINPKRLTIAEQCQIPHCINSSETPLEIAISECFGTDGADVILDCAGVQQTISSAVQCAQRGSRLAVIANFKAPVEMELVLLQRKEVTLYGIMMYLRQDFEEAIRLVAQGNIHTKELITNHFPIRQIQEAYQYIDDHFADVMKVVLTF
ncbi:alcohol dehydrogenase [candidate division KSB3 bacterium]|uniref:Alcohol dehydrogenase n=1 Tax=candidate division KSB3 bacterium TaxID=2044937 RepID=A0A2G6KED3_9BACT|nr:MAG: alcohol dehydrogenase [candidate division KSB3 bacterium]